MKTPINPITLWGQSSPEPPNHPRHLSIGRLWLSSDPEKMWDKRITIILWEGEEENPQILATLKTTEEVFIPAMQNLKNHNIPALLTSQYPLSITISRHNQDQAKISTCSDLTKMFVPWDRLWEGLSHLFPKGEINWPDRHSSGVPIGKDETCGCGLYIHPTRRNALASHCSDCKWKS